MEERSLGYCRVSTQRQFSEGHGLERYIDRLKKYGLTEGQIYWDIESGTNEKREGYNKVLQLVRSHQVDKIIVPCFDRFTRSALGWEVARQELQRFGVELVFLDGGSLDLKTPEGLFTSRILAAMSAQVRDKNRYNSIQGHRFFQEKRKVYQAIFGLKKLGDRIVPNLDPYKNTDATIRDIALEIIEMFLETGNLSATVEYGCNRYGYDRDPIRTQDFPRTGSSLKRWMENPLLCGRIRYYAEEPDKTIIVDSDNEGLVDIHTWDEIVALLERNPKGRQMEQDNPLVSLCFCGHCGSRLRKIKLPGRHKRYWKEYLQCLGAKNRAGKPIICTHNKFYKFDDAINAVIRAIVTKAKSIAIAIDEDVPTISPEITALQSEILKLKSFGDADYEPVIAIKERKLESLILNSTREVGANYRRDECLRFVNNDKFWADTPRGDLTPIFQDLINKVICSVSEDGSQSFSIVFK